MDCLLVCTGYFPRRQIRYFWVRAYAVRWHGELEIFLSLSIFLYLYIHSTVAYLGGSFGVLTVHGVLFGLVDYALVQTFCRDLLLWIGWSRLEYIYIYICITV